MSVEVSVRANAGSSDGGRDDTMRAILGRATRGGAPRLPLERTPAMPMYNDPYGWWGGKWQAPTPMSVIQILESGSMDARLLATCWLTIERRGSVLIAADPMQDAGKTTTITAMLDFVPEEHWIVFPRGWYEDWAFTENEAVKNGQAVIAINEWSDHLASYMWGPGIRRCFDLMDTHRYSVITAMHDDTVEGVLEQLRDDVGVPARQLGHLTLVIILRLIRMNGRIHRRMATMHYLESVPDGPPRIVPAMRWDGASDTHTHHDVADDLGPRLGVHARCLPRRTRPPHRVSRWAATGGHPQSAAGASRPRCLSPRHRNRGLTWTSPQCPSNPTSATASGAATLVMGAECNLIPGPFLSVKGPGIREIQPVAAIR